jgi:hypothetical protein
MFLTPLQIRKTLAQMCSKLNKCHFLGFGDFDFQRKINLTRTYAGLCNPLQQKEEHEVSCLSVSRDYFFAPLHSYILSLFSLIAPRVAEVLLSEHSYNKKWHLVIDWEHFCYS